MGGFPNFAWRRPRRPLPRPAAEEGGRAQRRAGGRAQPALRYLRLGRRVLRPDARQPRRRRPGNGARHRRRASITGTTSTSTSRAARSRSGGHGFCGIGRKRLLNILQARCRPRRRSWSSRTTSTDDRPAPVDADLVVACDGLNSRIRTRYAEHFQPDIDLRRCRFVWLGTHKLFDAFTFAFEETEHGWFQAHAYQFDRDTSTFIVETPEETWRAAGLDKMAQGRGDRLLRKLFARYLDGHALMSNASHLRGSAIWIRFPRVVCRKWVHWYTGWGRRRAGRADGRRGAHRAFLDRLRHQARAGRRDRACPRIRAPAIFRGALEAYQRSAASRSSRSRTRRAIRPSGSRTSSATRRWRPSSSPTACSRARSAYPTKTCGCARPRLR